MAFVVPTSGAIDFDVACVDKMLDVSASAYLYVNDVTPAKTHTVGDFAPAAAMLGVNVSLLYSSVTGSNGTGSYNANPITFTQTSAAAQTAFGWYVTDGSTLFFAERFISTYSLLVSGDQVRISDHTFRLHSP